MEVDINNERDVRLAKLQEIRKQGVNPYPPRVEKSHTTKAVLDNFDVLEKDQTEISTAGRVMLMREHGSIAFVKLQDDSETIQLVLTKKDLGDDIFKDFFEQIDMGDFISIHGMAFKTKKGESSILISSYTLISKSLLPLPEKFHGLTDIETRLRKRYVDLIINSETKDLFKKRSLFIKSMRDFLEDNNFLEVETPVLEHVPGGAEAEPFITHHNTLDIDLYLRISLELHLKRLIVGGFDRIYEIGRVFRNEGMSTQHLQEFTMMECYWAYADYKDMMKFTQEMYQQMIEKTFGTLKVSYQGQLLDFSKDFPRIDYVELIKEKSGIDLDQFDDVNDLKKVIKEKKIEIKFEKTAGLGRVIDQLYKKIARPELFQPMFLINHPVAISPLAKKMPENEKRTERFQVLFAGAEVGNAFSELNDPIDQKERFEEQQALREAGDNEAQMIDEDFITALEYGMPPTAGFGVGLDRFFSIVADASSVREVVFFPTMKPEK